ncbi:MAG: DUF885 domain-containing protein [Jiangellaceae bacterium]
MTAPQTARTVDDIAAAHVAEAVALDPIIATYVGLPGHDHQLTDFSPEGFAERRAHVDRTLSALDATNVGSDRDEIARAAMRAQLETERDLHDVGQDRQLNVIASPAQMTRMIFDLMDTGGEEGWANIAARLRQVPAALDGYRATMRADIAVDIRPARRQVLGVVPQCERIAGGFFSSLVADGAESLRADLDTAAAAAAEAYADFARFLTDEIAGHAREHDAIGREVYAVASRFFLGASVDLDETYEWGVAELARIETEMRDVAGRIVPGGSVDDAVKAVDADPRYNIEGTEALQVWMQNLSDTTIAAMNGRHFDIPKAIQRLECRIAPTKDGGIYYTGPSDDLSRPGRMWWSVPEGVETFSTWRETTTVFHEGVPGHHLQIAQVVYNRELLNIWQRLFAGTSGHAEGWALYAERLMQELGFLDDPADRLGMLDAHTFRASRVVIDIGMHLGKEVPESLVRADGLTPGVWTPESAYAFLRAHCRMPDEFLRFELDRYLGWPGQAPSYKVGERIWLEAREDVRRRQGDAFDLKAFHKAALDLGGMGLDPLKAALARL